MTDAHILLHVPGLGHLALTPDAAQAALLRGQELAGSLLQPGLVTSRPTEGSPSSPETLLDADAMAAATGVPASWFLSAARSGSIPCVKFGRWPRFNLAAVTEAMQQARKNGAERKAPDAATGEFEVAAPKLPMSQRQKRAQGKRK